MKGITFGRVIQPSLAGLAPKLGCLGDLKLLRYWQLPRQKNIVAWFLPVKLDPEQVLKRLKRRQGKELPSMMKESPYKFSPYSFSPGKKNNERKLRGL